MHNKKPNKRIAGIFATAGKQLAVLSLTALAGCATQHKDAIVFGTNTQVGAKIGVDEKKIPTIMVGYNRQEAALIPLLAHGNGKLLDASYRNLDTSTYLELAIASLDNLYNSPADANLKDESLKLIELAKVASTRKTNEKNESPTIPAGIKALNTEATTVLTKATLGPADKPKILELKLRTQAELKKPTTAITYLEDLKFVANSRKNADDHILKDAYSVIGIFAGNANGSARTNGDNSTVSGKGSIAQYFATGIAAQNISTSSAAVNSNPSAVKEAENAKIMISKAKAEQITVQKTEETQLLYSLLAPADAINTAAVDKLFDTTTGTVLKASANTLTDIKNDPIKLKSYIDDDLTPSQRKTALQTLKSN